jgi:hypothetical protein
MNTCSCRNSVEDQDLLCSRCPSLRILGLEANATGDEIKAAYRMLVKVWHPDRFQNDSNIKEVAEAKLKNINSAFAFLSSESLKRERERQPSPVSQKPPSNAQCASNRPRRCKSRPNVTPIWRHYLLIRPTIKILFRIAIVACVLVLGRYLNTNLDLHGTIGEEVVKVYGDSKESVLYMLEAPKRRFQEVVEQDLQRLGL